MVGDANWEVHFRHAGLNHPEQLCILLVPPNNLPRNHSSCLLNCVNVRLLVYPKAVQDTNQAHVPVYERFQRLDSTVGNDRSLYDADRVPP